MKLFRCSLASRMATLILLGAGLVLLAVLVVSHIVMGRVVLGQIEARGEAITAATTNRIEAQLVQAETVVDQAVALFSLLPADRETAVELIQRSLAVHPDLFGMAVALAPDGDESRGFRILYGMAGPDGVQVTDRESPELDYQQDWFYLPWQMQRPVWVEPYYDPEAGALMVTYAAPVMRQGRVLAVLTCDLSLEWLRSMLDQLSLGEGGIAILLSARGAFISHPQRELEIGETIFSLAESMEDPEAGRALAGLGRKMLGDQPGYELFMRPFEDERAYMYYRPVAATGWALGAIFPERQIRDATLRLGRINGLVGGAGLVLLLLPALAIAWSVAHPLRRLALAAGRLATGDFEAPLPRTRCDDEVGRLTEAFGKMRHDLGRYIADLADATAAKEKVASELAIAREIQMGMVPKLFPPFPDRPDLDLYAVLEPAREVGGDLYDFSLIDENHLYVAIGDVSGKGVPASLLMAVGKTLLKSTIQAVRDPARALAMVNDELAEDNEACMFITLFCGILNLQTGDLIYANAGHNPPILIRAGGKVEWLADKAGPALAALPGSVYPTRTVRLAVDDMLALYTDGVTEAMDRTNTLFSEDRLFAYAGQEGRRPTREFVQRLVQEIHAHADGTEPSDDITLLAVRHTAPLGAINGDANTVSETKTPDATLTLANRRDELARLADWIETLGRDLAIPGPLVMSLNLALEEWVVNVISYAWEDGGEHALTVRLWRKDNLLRIEVEDDGRPFDPTAQADADTGASLEHRRIGGLGIHFIRRTMDRFTYRREGERNLVAMTKRIDEGQGGEETSASL